MPTRPTITSLIASITDDTSAADVAGLIGAGILAITSISIHAGKIVGLAGSNNDRFCVEWDSGVRSNVTPDYVARCKIYPNVDDARIMAIVGA